MGMGLRIPLHIYQVTSGQALCSKTRLFFYRMQGFWVYKMAVPLGLGALPQETPVNGKKTQKSVPYKMPAPGLFGSSKPCHFVSSCLIEWFVSKSPQIVCHPLSPGTSAFFLPVPEASATQGFDHTFSNWST